MIGSSLLRRVAASSLCAMIAATAGAATLLDDTRLIGLPTVAAPVEFPFATTMAQALTVTLTDLQTPAVFQSLQVAVTLGDALVGTASVDATTHKATLALPAAIGNYVLHVVGTPDPTQNFGGFYACVAPATSATSCIAADSFSGTVETPAPPSITPNSSLTTNFTSTTPGTYSVTITDDAFPVALQMLGGGIASGSTPVTSLSLGTTQVTLAAATSYTLIVGAVADATATAGLYGVHITDPSGAVVFDRTRPVGTLADATVVQNASAQSLNLMLTDLQYPAALTALGAAVTAGGSPVLGKLTTAGTVAVTAPSGPLEVWKYTSAASQPGAYSLSLAGATTNLVSTTQVVNPASNGSTGSYAFLVDFKSAGSYQLTVTDFQFPATLQSLSPTIAQNGTVLATDTNGVFTASAGVAVVVVNATAPQTGNGIFAVTVQTTATPATIVLDQTQAVGGVFDTRSITVGQSGGYNVTLTDLAFPANFANLAVVLSQGSQILGKIYGGGSFPVSVTPGQPYVLTFVATPSTTAAVATNDNYGLYAINFSSAAPSITFTSNVATVASGQAVQLTWSSSDASSCTAAGATGWTGNEATSGTLGLVITANASLTLTCTGDGGSTTQTLAIAATAAPAKSGGGGTLSPAWLLLLASLVASRRLRGEARATA